MNKKTLALHFLGPGLTAIISFFTLPVLSRYYSISDIGQFSLLQLIANFSVIVFSLGLNQAYVREYYESKDKLALTFNLISVPLIIVSLIFIIGVLCGIDISYYIFDFSSKNIDIMIFSSVLSYLLTSMLMHILRMEERTLAYAIFMVLPKAQFLFFGVVSYLSIGSSYSLLLIYCFLASNVITLVFAIFSNRITIRKAIQNQRYFYDLYEMLKYGLPLVIGGLGFWLLVAMDKIFIKEMSNLNELGKYSIAVNFTAVIALFSTVFLNIYNPLVFKWSKDNQPLTNYISVMNIIFVFSLILWCLAGLLSSVIPYILPDNVTGVEELFIVLIGGPILKFTSESTKVGFGIQRRPTLSIIPILFSCIINALLNYFLIPVFGAKGAAISSLISFWVLFVSRTEISSRIWISFPRLNFYLYTFPFVIWSILSLEIRNRFGLEYSIMVWLGFVILVVFLFKERVRISLKNLSKC